VTPRLGTGESSDLRVVQSNLTFPILYPGYLPYDAAIVSARWWGDGTVTELHLSSDHPALPIRGLLTIKEWSDAGIPQLGAGRPGRNADARPEEVAGTLWFVSTEGGVCMVEGRRRSTNVQLLGVLSADETLKVAGSLQAAN
jgi:hypothetical protein